MSVSIVLLVNGLARHVEVDPVETLLQTLRERLGLTGTKDGCSEGECGACTVLVDGQPIDSCLLASLAVAGSSITTIEGVGDATGEPSPLQQAMIRSGAIQCGFCTPGIVMTLTALLARDSEPSEHDVRDALAGNICRCTGYHQIVEAVTAAIAHRP